ncbi:MAG: DNA photolyase [Desulfobacterota bacterium]|nr:DNA photolyase [Thermodesulfobacteriota bacterium]
MQRFVPDHIFIEASVAQSILTRTVIDRCPGVPSTVIPDSRELIRAYRTTCGGGFEKRSLLLCKNRGRFLEPCPGTRGYICCGYMVLTPGIGCPLDCSYCVLQAYLNNPFITLYANQDDLFNALRSVPQGIVRIGTGEFMDSLALDHLTDFSRTALPIVARIPGLVLELKTKTDNIENLLDLDHLGSYIISWSLNTESIAVSEEKGAATIQERIRAARRVVACGYRVGFHFDPLIVYPDCEVEYQNVISLLEENIPPDAVAWISIGSLRFMPHLKKTALQRFPSTAIFSGEFVPGLDGKMRYLQEIRLELYRILITMLRQWSREVLIYFCMENDFVWQRTLGCTPGRQCSTLKEMLDQKTRRC